MRWCVRPRPDQANQPVVFDDRPERKGYRHPSGGAGKLSAIIPKPRTRFVSQGAAVPQFGSSPDSPLEGNGFELLVRGRVKLVVGRRRTGRDGSPPRNWQISCWCGAAPPALWRSRLEDALVQHGGPESVDSVMVDGRWLMRGQALLAFDEAAALTEGEGSGRRFAGAHGSAAGDVGRNAAGARLGRCRATGSSYLASTSGTFLVMLSAHHRAMC
jgi:hypothetical protein